MEFTISKDDRWLEARTRERASATLQRLAVIWDDEADELERVAAITDALADAGGIEAAQTARHSAEGRLRELEGQVGWGVGGGWVGWLMGGEGVGFGWIGGRWGWGVVRGSERALCS